jgi:phosphoglycerate dehydrogenase-like enzyme
VQQSEERPVLVVLCEDTEPPPDLPRTLRDRLDVRVSDARSLSAALEEASALLLWDFFSEALAEAWAGAGRLRWVHVAAAGVDKLLFPALVDSDVVVTNARGIFDRPIAEFVLAAVLAHAKDLRTSWDQQRQEVWRHRETLPIAGTRAMVVGTGAIGRETARLLRAVGVEVLGAGRTDREGDPDFERVVSSTELVEHVRDVDHLVVAAPLTPATRGLVDAAVLAALPPHAHLINIGRGPIVDETALVAALEAGRLAAASLDVFSTEPLPPGHPLWSTRGVFVSAHMSGDVVGWRESLTRQFVDNAESWLAGRPLVNVVDKRLGFSAPAEPARSEENA